MRARLCGAHKNAQRYRRTPAPAGVLLGGETTEDADIGNLPPPLPPPPPPPRMPSNGRSSSDRRSRPRRLGSTMPAAGDDEEGTAAAGDEMAREAACCCLVNDEGVGGPKYKETRAKVNLCEEFSCNLNCFRRSRSGENMPICFAHDRATWHGMSFNTRTGSRHGNSSSLI